MVDIKEIKNQLTKEQIIKILALLGTDCKERNDGTLIFRTVCHHKNNEGSYKLHYFPESKMFKCYTQCGDAFDIYELICRNQNMKFKEALQFLCANLGIKNIKQKGFKVKPIADWDVINKYLDFGSIKQDFRVKTYNSNMLKFYSNLYKQEWINEGISLKTMKKYKIKFDISGNKIIIPHYNINGSLIGIRGRNFNEYELSQGQKYMPVFIQKELYSHPLGMNLYGLNITKGTIKKSGKVLIFEGEKSVMKCDSLYGKSNFTVAACGSSISNYQKSLILNLGVREVFIAFDKPSEEIANDKELLDKYMQRIGRLASKFSPYFTTYILWDTENLLNYKDSPVDKGQEVLEQLMKNKIEVYTESEES